MRGRLTGWRDLRRGFAIDDAAPCCLLSIDPYAAPCTCRLYCGRHLFIELPPWGCAFPSGLVVMAIVRYRTASVQS